MTHGSSLFLLLYRTTTQSLLLVIDHRQGDLVWNCKTCQIDDTCVVCNECYRNADHEGHEVFFFYSNTEGCCDCGDENVWSPSGFCTKHGVRHGLPAEHTPVDDLPASMVPVARELVVEVCSFIQEVHCEENP